MLKLYDYLPSGNGYKVRLLLCQLGLPFELVERDILKGETRTPEFLAINPNGKIPVLEFEDGRRLVESNAILFHLAEGTRFLADDRWGRALTLQWLFFEQYSHEPYIAVARFWIHSLNKRRGWEEGGGGVGRRKRGVCPAPPALWGVCRPCRRRSNKRRSRSRWPMASTPPSR